MKKIKAKKMATGGLMSMPPFIKDEEDKKDMGISPYDVNTPASARKGMPSRMMSPSRTRFNKGGNLDLDGSGDTTMKDVLIGRGVIKKKNGGSIDKNVRVIDLQKKGKTSKKGIRVKGKGKSFMDVYKKTVYNRADGGMVPFGGEKRVPGSGAATRGTGFKGIF